MPENSETCRSQWLKDIWLMMLYNKGKQQILTYENLEPENVHSFCSIKSDDLIASVLQERYTLQNDKYWLL